MQSSLIVIGIVLLVVWTNAASAPGKKPGECPPNPEGQMGTCDQACKGDRYCPGDEKCCSNGCGNNCKDPQGKSCPLFKCKDGCAMKKLPNDKCASCYCDEEPLGASLQNACKEAGGECTPGTPEGPQDRYLCKTAETCLFKE